MFLRTLDERKRLLKAGLTGKQIETVFVVLNGYEIVGVKWQDRYTTDPGINSVFEGQPLPRQNLDDFIPLENYPFGNSRLG